MTDQEQLRVRDETNDSYGHQSIRVEQLFAGSELPIFDSSSLADFTREGALLHIQPGFHEDLSNVARTAAFTQIAAEQTAIDHTRRACSLGPAEVATIKTTTLGVAAEPQGFPARAIDLAQLPPAARRSPGPSARGGCACSRSTSRAPRAPRPVSG